MAMREPKQQRAMQTRASLMEVGRAAFALKGLDGASLTTDILEPAGVSAGSFYHQFEDKTDLLIAILDEAASRRKAMVIDPELFDGLPLQDLIEVVAALFIQSLETRGHDWRIQIREWHSPDPRVRARIRSGRNSWRDMSAQLLARYCADEARCTAVADVVVVYFLGVMVRYFEHDEAERDRVRRDLPGASADLLMNGLPALLGIDPSAEPLS